LGAGSIDYIAEVADALESIIRRSGSRMMTWHRAVEVLKSKGWNVNDRTLKLVVGSHPGRFFVKQRGLVSSVWDMVGIEERKS
jgi:hypothetical protein